MLGMLLLAGVLSSAASPPRGSSVKKNAATGCATPPPACDLLRPSQREPWEPLTVYAERATREWNPRPQPKPSAATPNSTPPGATAPAPDRTAMAKSLATLRALISTAKKRLPQTNKSGVSARAGTRTEPPLGGASSSPPMVPGVSPSSLHPLQGTMRSGGFRLSKPRGPLVRVMPPLPRRSSHCAAAAHPGCHPLWV